MQCIKMKVYNSLTLCVAVEYAEFGALYDYLRLHTIDFHQILLWAKQIAMGMNYLHYEAPVPVIHRDLKSKNGELKLPQCTAFRYTNRQCAVFTPRSNSSKKINQFTTYLKKFLTENVNCRAH